MITTLVQLAGLFAVLSLLSVGGGNGTIPDMQRASVSVHHWMTNQEFLDLFAISRAGPGPGSLLVVLVGQKAAGLVGALVAGLAMYVPSCLIVHFATRLWGRAAESSWRKKVEQALAPIAVGLMYGSGIALVQTTEHSYASYGITAASTFVLSVADINPLFVLVGGACCALLAG